MTCSCLTIISPLFCLYVAKLFLTQTVLGYPGPGPKYPPTHGQIWPKPQHEWKSDAVYIYRSSKFTYTVTSHTCRLLTRALERYDMVLKDLELLKRKKDFSSVLPSHHSQNVSRGHRTMTRLEVKLTATCEDNPHYDMEESYTLVVGDVSRLQSGSIWGILRGLESFAQLFYLTNDYSEININATNVVDYPAYKHRGLLIDTGRHYLSLSTIYNIVDALAINKMNVLHWHITDDQSFPYQSEKFPALSEKGAFFPSMVYTKEDIRSLVSYARERGVRVIPELDVPGHTQSWGVAYPQLLAECYFFDKVVGLGPLDPTRNETYQFLEQLFGELHQWFPDQFLHIGGDEVQINCWRTNPLIQAFLKRNKITSAQLQGYFMNRTLPLLPTNVKPIVWQEVFDSNALPNQKTHVQVWNWQWVVEMDNILKAGHYVIFSSSWYLDYKNQPWEEFYRADPRAMVFNLRRSAAGLEAIVGGEACMWGEMADDTNILSKTWPRTSAVAERLWTGLAYNANNEAVDPVTDDVRRRIEEHACRMNRRGIPAQPPNGPGFCVGASPRPLRN